ncbi:MAG: response regulator [bacterium]|nr:response regulator [bacterium]
MYGQFPNANPLVDSISQPDTASSLLDAWQVQPELQPLENDASRPTILLLEDDPALLWLLQQHLQSLPVKTLATETINQARHRLSEQCIDLAILDIHLPDGSGLELCAEMDESPELMGIPVIILSSSSDPDVVRRSRSSGGCFFISKPYDPNVLLTIIERALGRNF